jgi:hypothetical protein
MNNLLKFQLFIGVMVCCLMGNLKAQKSTPSPLRYASEIVKISVSPANILFKTIGISFEHALETQWSIALKASGTYFNTIIWDSFEGTLEGYSLTPEMRYYMSDHAPHGIYMAAWAKYGNHRFFINDPKEAATKLTLFQQKGFQTGGSLGWQFGIGKKSKGMPFLTVDTSVGGGYKFNTIDTRFATTGRFLHLKGRGFSPLFDILIGVPF